MCKIEKDTGQLDLGLNPDLIGDCVYNLTHYGIGYFLVNYCTATRIELEYGVMFMLF